LQVFLGSFKGNIILFKKVVLICLGAFLDIGSCSPVREFPQFSLSNYLVALGTMLFTYGGHSAFPTIQHDMKRPSHFDRSAIFGFICLFFQLKELFLIFSNVIF